MSRKNEKLKIQSFQQIHEFSLILRIEYSYSMWCLVRVVEERWEVVGMSLCLEIIYEDWMVYNLRLAVGVINVAVYPSLF